MLLGSALPQGTQHTIGRTAALRAGLPVTVAGMTLDRQCSSGLMTIATAAKQVMVDRRDVVVAGGVESISLVQTPALRVDRIRSLLPSCPKCTCRCCRRQRWWRSATGSRASGRMPYALRSQRLTAKAQEAGAVQRRDCPGECDEGSGEQASGTTSMKEVVLDKDEGNRPETSAEGLAA